MTSHKPLFVLLMLMVPLCFMRCRDNVRIYEIPEGYQGWVTVHYEPECATSTTGNAGTTIVVRSDGSGCAKVKPAPKSFYRRFYYVSATGARVRELRATGWGKGGEVWSESSTVPGDEYRFFVGPEDAFKKTYETSTATK